MTRLLPIVGIILLVTGSFLYIRFSKQSQNLSKPVVDRFVSSLDLQDRLTSGGSIDERIATLESAVLDLAQQIGDLKNQKTDKSSISGQSSNLDVKVENLQQQINVLKQSQSSTSQSTTQTASKSPLYIPLGWVGSSSKTDWSGITTQTTVIDSGDYPGYKSAQFEVNLQLFQGNGKAYARLLNSTNNLSLLESEITTTSQNYTWVSSTPFQLGDGKKTYYMELKSLTGYAVNVQDARIRINF